MPNVSTITSDYHMHSSYSQDGDHSPEAMCQQALRLGLTDIAITEHAEWHPHFAQQGFPKVDDYFLAMEECRSNYTSQGLRVYSGVELGNPHQNFEQATHLIESYSFDVTIASLHWLDGKNIHLEECFASKDPYDVYADYFIQLQRMAADFHVDIVGHFDRIIWRGTELGHLFDPSRIEKPVRHALATIAHHDKALEINTRFLAEPRNWNRALITMFRWFWEAGGTTVVVNSDAHRVTEMGRNRDIAVQILMQAGFTSPEQYLPKFSSSDQVQDFQASTVTI